MKGVKVSTIKVEGLRKLHFITTGKVTIYLSDQQYELLNEFANLASYNLGISRATRFLLLNELSNWVKKERKN